MPFQNIYEAALRQDAAALKQAIGVGCIDEWKEGILYHSAATQLAMEGNQAAAEFLLDHGAHINYVAFGAAIGGHRDYAEALMARGAVIHHVAEGAALGGHHAYTERLLARGAPINSVAHGAARWGDWGYVETLLGRGAAIRAVANGIVKACLFSNSSKCQLHFLAYFKPTLLPRLLKAIKGSGYFMGIKKDTGIRAMALSKSIHLGKLDLPQAFIKTDRAYGSLLVILTSLVMHHDSHFSKKLPVELWFEIFNLFTPQPLTASQLNRLGFFMGRALLSAQLTRYQKGWLNTHKKMAKRLNEAISNSVDKEALSGLVRGQMQSLAGRSPYPASGRKKIYNARLKNSTVDSYQLLLTCWNERLSGESPNFLHRP